MSECSDDEFSFIMGPSSSFPLESSVLEEGDDVHPSFRMSPIETTEEEDAYWDALVENNQQEEYPSDEEDLSTTLSLSCDSDATGVSVVEFNDVAPTSEEYQIITPAPLSHTDPCHQIAIPSTSGGIPSTSTSNAITPPPSSQGNPPPIPLPQIIFPAFGIEELLEYSKRNRHVFTVYTGFKDYEKFQLVLASVTKGDQGNVLRWSSNAKAKLDRIDSDQWFSEDRELTDFSPHPGFSPSMPNLPRKMKIEDEFLMVMMRIRMGLKVEDLAQRFKISIGTVSELFITWLNFLYIELLSLKIWPHRDYVMEQHPEEFHRRYPTNQIIIDGVEFYLQRSSSLNVQSQTYSSYKSHNTLKCLVGVDPSGGFMFVSQAFGGRISDKQLVLRSGFLDVIRQKLETGEMLPGDAVMADKGFTIEDELREMDIQLNIPPFRRGELQFSPHDVIRTRSIAAHRIHVERAIRKVKVFGIFDGKQDITVMGTANQLWTVACILTNFMPPILNY